jgi:hypothetical protein
MADKKKIGYYVSRGKCVKAYKLQNPKTKKYTGKRVSESGRKLKEGTRVFKTKALCMKYIAKKEKSKAKKVSSKPVKKRAKKVAKKLRMNKFGQCAYSVPYFGGMVPSVGKYWSGTPETGITSGAWAWPSPGALSLDKQQGSW